MATYQAFSAPISDTLAHFQAWAQFFGGGFTTIGWVAQTGHGELPATGSGASYAFTSPVLPVAALNPMAIYTYRGAWVSGTAYSNGSNTQGGTADLVTDNSVGGNGITYQKITTNVATNLTTAPHSNATDWLPIQFEIWKSNGSNTSSLPIYVRLTYTTAGAANNTYRFFLSIGTGIDSNGNITGAVPMTGTAPTTTLMNDNSTTTSSVVAEMDMAGDADNFRFILWRGHSTALFIQTCVIDRAKNSNGADTDAYFYAGTILLQGGGTLNRSCIIPNPAIGNGALNSTSGAGWAGVIWCAGNTNSMVVFGTTPPLPIFPLIGYLANPLLGAVGFHKADVVDGNVIPVWAYGATHLYLVNAGSGAALSQIDNQSSGGVIPAILWE